MNKNNKNGKLKMENENGGGAADDDYGRVIIPWFQIARTASSIDRRVQKPKGSISGMLGPIKINLQWISVVTVQM
jgi:hypothetical protein